MPEIPKILPEGCGLQLVLVVSLAVGAWVGGRQVIQNDKEMHPESSGPITFDDDFDNEGSSTGPDPIFGEDPGEIPQEASPGGDSGRPEPIFPQGNAPDGTPMPAVETLSQTGRVEATLEAGDRSLLDALRRVLPGGDDELKERLRGSFVITVIFNKDGQRVTREYKTTAQLFGDDDLNALSVGTEIAMDW